MRAFRESRVGVVIDQEFRLRLRCPNRTYAPAVPTARGRRSRLLGNSILTWQTRVTPLINGTMAVVNDAGSRLREQVVTKRLQSGDVRASMETDLKSMANIKLCGWVRNTHTPFHQHLTATSYILLLARGRVLWLVQVRSRSSSNSNRRNDA